MLRFSWVVWLLIGLNCRSIAQELFVYSEPASNMPAKSVGLRITGYFYPASSIMKTGWAPEVLWGISKRFMIHTEAYFNNSDISGTQGFALYGKYRFLSVDDIHKHFRMAAWGRLAYNNTTPSVQELNTGSTNGGAQLGIIATQLLHKTALSASMFFEQSDENRSVNALNYIISTGHLFLPVHYRSYKQTNLNLMVELIGQHLFKQGDFQDVAISAQTIVNSQTRFEFGYRFQLNSTITRYSGYSALIRLEHTLFRVLPAKHN